MTSNTKSQMITIFFTVFLYLVGFGVIIPILPILSTNFGATALETGLLLSAYSLMQFIFSPIWGKLSDKYGRRSILLFCLVGEVVCYLIFAWARTLEMLFVARILAGFFGASISTASAYISDITTKEERSKGMALIGAAFGLGFVVGPALGGGLSVWGRHISDAPHFDTSFVSYWVSGLYLATFVFAYFFLKESLNPQSESAEKKKRFSTLFAYLQKPTIGPLMIVFMFCTLAMSAMEASLILYMGERFSWGIKQVSFGFVYIGFIIIFTQGYLVRKLIPRWGERKVLRLGVLLFAIGLSSIAVSPNIGLLTIAMTLLSLGNGLINPSTLGSISLLAPAEEQGSAMGVTQSMSSLGRIIGPAVGGAVYGYLITAPFIFSGLLAFIAFLIILAIYTQIPEHGKKA